MILKSILIIYEKLNTEAPDIIRDINNGYLTDHEARNGRPILWYMDETNNIAIYTDTLDILSNEEIEKELL